ncbi:DUF551 domain-containing protein [Klebsiella pneumoniae]
MTNNQLTSTHLAVKSELDGYKIHASRGQATAMAMVRLFESIDRDLEELQERRKAAMDSEPVAIIDQANLDYLRSGADADVWPPEREEMGDVLLYRHAQPAPVVPNGLRLALSNAGIAAPESDEMLAATCEKHIQALVTWVKDRKPFQSAPVVPSFEEWLSAANRKPLGWVKDAMREAYDACRAAMLQTGISAVIPDGYVMVPKEPTEEMNKAGWAAMNEHDAINPTYRAMIAAAQHETPALNSVQSVATVPGKWIPVSERMPEDRKQVILWDAEIGEVTSGHYSHKTQTFYHCGDAIENEITHWMPPPCAPQEVKSES